MDSQLVCRKRENGFTGYRCPEGHKEKEIYHSCRDRGCTVCGARKQQQWLTKQNQRLLNCDHFHLVFTLPGEYRLLWLYNRKWFIKNQFEVVSETLKTLLEPNKKGKKSYLEAVPGFISVLHTWGRQLNIHPHIHCLVSAGGLDPKGKWKDVEGDFLLPIRVLKMIYRGKFQERIKLFLESGDAKFPPSESREALLIAHKQLYKKQWSVRIQEKYSHGKGVLNYLSRYLGGKAINPKQIESMTDKEVRFRYKDHRDGKTKILRLKTDEFMRRYLMHQPERGVHTIRYYGLYGSQSLRKKSLSDAQLGTRNEQTVGNELWNGVTHAIELLCDCCGAEMKAFYIGFRGKIEKPLIKQILCRTVQQDDEDRPTEAGFVFNSS